MICSDNCDQHLQHVSQVLSRLRNAGSISKVALAVQNISFFGHRVLPLRVPSDPDRTQAIPNFPPSNDVKGITRLLGVVHFYHKLSPVWLITVVTRVLRWSYTCHYSSLLPTVLA